MTAAAPLPTAPLTETTSTPDDAPRATTAPVGPICGQWQPQDYRARYIRRAEKRQQRSKMAPEQDGLPPRTPEQQARHQQQLDRQNERLREQRRTRRLTPLEALTETTTSPRENFSKFYPSSTVFVEDKAGAALRISGTPLYKHTDERFAAHLDRVRAYASTSAAVRPHLGRSELERKLAAVVGRDQTVLARALNRLMREYPDLYAVVYRSVFKAPKQRLPGIAYELGISVPTAERRKAGGLGWLISWIENGTV